MQSSLCFQSVEQSQLSKQRSLGSQLPQSGVPETGQRDVKETVYGGFWLSRTCYPVEISTATVVWQQSTNTPLSTCIASRMETQTVKMPNWQNTRFPSDLRSGEVYTQEQASLRVLHEVLWGCSVFSKNNKKNVGLMDAYAVHMLFFFVCEGILL